MSVQNITIEMFHCACDRTECSYNWDAKHVPQRCPKCKSRRWNRPARISTREPITFNGETMTVSQWSRKLGLSRSVIPWRMKQGWPIEQVLSNEDWRFQK